MKSISRGLHIELSEEERKGLLREVASFYITEREEDLDIIASNEILDFFIDTLGPAMYNKAIQDTRELLKKELEEIDFKLQVLRR